MKKITVILTLLLLFVSSNCTDDTATNIVEDSAIITDTLSTHSPSETDVDDTVFQVVETVEETATYIDPIDSEVSQTYEQTPEIGDTAETVVEETIIETQIEETQETVIEETETEVLEDTIVEETVIEDTEVLRCTGLSASPGTQNRTIQINGRTREYILSIPQAYSGDDPVPLILDFHGITGNGQGQMQSSTYPSVVGPEGVIMAFPTGLPGPMGNAWNVGPCCVGNVDDVAFARAIVEDIKTVACINPSKVYAVGFSMGGGLSHYLACNASDVFAAVAPAAFDLLEENVGSCNPSRPITVVMFRGTSDFIVPYDGGYSSVVNGMPITFLGADATFSKWAELNDCSGTPTDVGNGCRLYSSSQCSGGVEVMLCTKQNGGHDQGDATNSWDILKQHSLP